MYKELLSKLKEINECDAMDLLEYNTYEGQRHLKPKHVTMLRREMENGLFLIGDIALARLDYEDKRKVLVNGQHQLKALLLAAAGGISIKVVFQEYSCPEAADLAELYRRFDNHASRSLGDVVSSEALALGVTWKQAVLRVVLSAAVFQKGAAELTKNEKAQFLTQYIRQGGFVNNIISDSRRCMHLMRAAVVCAMMETYDKDWQSAKIFWEDVRDGAELKKDDPALLLKNYLQTTAVSCNNRKASTRYDIVSSREMYIKCLHAWNACRRGTKTNLKYVADAPIPRLV